MASSASSTRVCVVFVAWGAEREYQLEGLSSVCDLFNSIHQLSGMLDEELPLSHVKLCVPRNDDVRMNAFPSKKPFLMSCLRTNFYHLLAPTCVCPRCLRKNLCLSKRNRPQPKAARFPFRPVQPQNGIMALLKN